MVRLALVGELDELTTHVLESALGEAMEAADFLVLDLQGLEFIDSSGLRLLLRARDQAEREGARLFLGPVSPAVERVLQVTGLHRFVEGGSPTVDPRRRRNRRPWR